MSNSKTHSIEVDEDPETGQRTSTVVNLPFADANLIVTHDGLMHADEILAIALIHVFAGYIPYRRTRKLDTKTFQDPNIIVLDQGGRYEPELSNFDHHHLGAKAGDATVSLVFRHLRAHNLISDEVASVLSPAIRAVSDYDIRGPFEFNGFQFNEYIKSLNTLTEDETANFRVALTIARMYVKSKVNLIEIEAPKSKKLWSDGFSPFDNIKVCREFPMFWKTYNQEKWLIVPDKVRKDQWILHAFDSRTNPIIPTGKEVFIHTNAFIAAYSSSVDAVEAAKKSQLCWR